MNLEVRASLPNQSICTHFWANCISQNFTYLLSIMSVIHCLSFVWLKWATPSDSGPLQHQLGESTGRIGMTYCFFLLSFKIVTYDENVGFS